MGRSTTPRHLGSGQSGMIVAVPFCEKHNGAGETLAADLPHRGSCHLPRPLWDQTMRYILIPTVAAERQTRVVWSQWYYTLPGAPCSTGRLSGSIQRWQGVYFFYIMCWYEKSTRYGGRSKVGKEVSPSSPSGMLASRSCRISAGRMRSPLFPCCSHR